MVFLGDIACPNNKIEKFVQSINSESFFYDKVIVYNLEGNILEEDGFENGLNNATRIVEAFSGAKKVIVSLANNHMYDYPKKINNTIEILKKNNIGYFGLVNKDNRIVPYEYYCVDTGQKYAFFGHCWSLYTKTNPNTENHIRIVDCDYNEFVSEVTEYIHHNSKTKVICFMHWNYDMEILPFPMLRKVSHILIDVGVEAVIGSHSHVPQGIEIYKGKLISYCLGNFYIPSGCFFDGALKYPMESKSSYIVNYIDNMSRFECKWFSTDIDDRKPISFDVVAEDACEQMKKLCVGFTLDDKQYQKNYLNNREKKLLVPHFKNYKGIVHRIDDWLAVERIKMIKTIKREKK